MLEKGTSLFSSTFSIVALWIVVLSLVARDRIPTTWPHLPLNSQHEKRKSTAGVPTVPAMLPPWQSESQKVRILSYDPFIAHIENFLTANERKHLIKLSRPLLTRSTVLYNNGTQRPSQTRTSSTAYLSADDFIVSAVRRRAAEFQGYLPRQSIDLQVTSYEPGQQYRPHYNWFPGKDRTINRLSTFFAILNTDCENCGTQFPNINITWSRKDSRWCRFMDCTQEILTSKNQNGSAILWRNLDEYGKGRKDVLHAGLPAFGGKKMRLNIWTDVDVAPYVQL